VAFTHSWGAGLAKLLEKLEEDGVPKDPRFNRTAVNDWWRTQFGAEQGLREEPEEYLSNWFPVTLPTHIYFHSLSRKTTGAIEVSGTLPYPAVQDGIFLITFGEAADFKGELGPEMYIAKAGDPLEVTALLAEPKTLFGKHLFQILRLAWEQMLDERKLPVYELANKARCFYFPKDRVPGDKVFFPGVDGERTYRAMVGYPRLQRGTWHPENGRGTKIRCSHQRLGSKRLNSQARFCLGRKKPLPGSRSH
jgi:hypothetical protein